MPRGLRQAALSISFLSPIVRRPAAFAVTKIASLIFRPERRFLALTSFQSLRRPSLSFGSSSLISLRRQSLSLSRSRLRPPGNIQAPSRFRLTRSTRPRFAAASFEDFAISYEHHLSSQPPPVPILKNIRPTVPSNACPRLRIERTLARTTYCDFGRHQCRTRFATISVGVRLSDVGRSLVVERRHCDGGGVERVAHLGGL